MPPVDGNARWVPPQRCDGPPVEWLSNASDLMDYGFTKAQAADLAFNGFRILGWVPVVELLEFLDSA